MARWRGKGYGAGLAMGTSAVIREVNGVPFPPEVPGRFAEVAQFHRTSELPEIILFAKHFHVAQAVAPTITWAIVVGFVIEDDPVEDQLQANIPSLFGVKGSIEEAEDDVLTLIDATRGVVLTDPDPVYLALYTAEHDKIAPKHRYSLDEGETPAQTLDGRTIKIFSLPSPPERLQELSNTGFDGFWLEMPLDFDPDVQLRALKMGGDNASGKPLLIRWDSILSPTALVRSASQYEIIVDVPLAINADQIAFSNDELIAAKAQLDEAVENGIENDKLSSLPKLSISLSWEPSTEIEEAESNLLQVVERAALMGIGRICVSPPDFSQSNFKILDSLASMAGANFLSLNLVVEQNQMKTIEEILGIEQARDSEANSSTLSRLIGAGVTEITCFPCEVSKIKQHIGTLSFSECREKLLSSF